MTHYEAGSLAGLSASFVQILWMDAGGGMPHGHTIPDYVQLEQAAE